MRNGFRSSRGAMRGIMGGGNLSRGAGLCDRGHRLGPFLKSVRLTQYSKLWLNSNYLSVHDAIMRSSLACAQSLDSRRDTLRNRNAAVHRPRAAEWPATSATCTPQTGSRTSSRPVCSAFKSPAGLAAHRAAAQHPAETNRPQQGDAPETITTQNKNLMTRAIKLIASLRP